MTYSIPYPTIKREELRKFNRKAIGDIGYETASPLSPYSILFLSLRLLRVRSIVPIMARATS
jgi:hypothetical protein